MPKKKVPTNYKAFILYEPGKDGYTLVYPDLNRTVQIDNIGQLSAAEETAIETFRSQFNQGETIEMPTPTMLYHEIRYLKDYQK